MLTATSCSFFRILFRLFMFDPNPMK